VNEIIFVSTTYDDVVAFSSIDDAERALEAADVRTGEYSIAFSSTLRAFDLRVRDDIRRLFWWSYAVPRVMLVPKATPIDAARVVQLLQRYLECPTVGDLPALLAAATRRAMGGPFSGRPFP
jgi:hypothetical protein